MAQRHGPALGVVFRSSSAFSEPDQFQSWLPLAGLLPGWPHRDAILHSVLHREIDQDKAALLAMLEEVQTIDSIAASVVSEDVLSQSLVRETFLSQESGT